MSTIPAQPLEVAVVLPATPYTLATSGFLQTLTAVEQEIAATTQIDTPEAAQTAATIQSRLTSAGIALEKQRKALKQPFVDAGRAIDAAAEAPQARIEAAKTTVKRLLTQYDDRERAKAAEAERQRQAELKRLADLATKEKAEADRKAKDIADALAAQAEATKAAMPDVEVMEMDEAVAEPVQKTETEKRIEQLQHAPVVVAPKPIGVTLRVTLQATVVDVNLLPDVFVERVPKLAALRATYCNGWKEGKAVPVVPGVKFEVVRTPVSTGR